MRNKKKELETEIPIVKLTKFQAISGKISNLSFWTWLGTICTFIACLVFVDRFNQIRMFWGVFFLNIMVGVIAFVIAIVTHLSSQIVTIEHQKSFLDSVKIVLIIILAIPAIVFASSTNSKLNGALSKNITTKKPESSITIFTPAPSPSLKPKATTTQPKVPQITCTGPDYKEFQTTEAECTKFRTSWGLSASATPWTTQAPQRQLQQPQGANYACKLNNSNGEYILFTVDSASCSRFQTQNVQFLNCTKIVNDTSNTCLSKCSAESEHTGDACRWAYLGANPGIEASMTLYTECSDEMWATKASCDKTCLDTFVKDLDSCRSVNN